MDDKSKKKVIFSAIMNSNENKSTKATYTILRQRQGQRLFDVLFLTTGSLANACKQARVQQIIQCGKCDCNNIQWCVTTIANTRHFMCISQDQRHIVLKNNTLPTFFCISLCSHASSYFAYVFIQYGIFIINAS